MDLKIVLKEIDSKAIQEITTAIWDTIERVQQERIQYQQGSVEIAGHKHILQSVALDWAFGKKRNRIGKLIKK